jgi:hypothetical protein
MRHCAQDHPHISWEDDELETCPLCSTVQLANWEAKEDAGRIALLKRDIFNMKERCICGKLAE